MHGVRVAGEEPAGEREGQRVDAVARLVDARHALDGEQRPEDLLVEHGRAGGQVGGHGRRRRTSRPRSTPSRALGHDPPALARPARGSARRARAPPARSPAARRSRSGRPGRRRGRRPRRPGARAAGRRWPRGRARARRPSTSARRRRTRSGRCAGTASSRSASLSTITQFLPPISATTRLRWRAAGRDLGGRAHDLQADRLAAGEGDRGHVGMAHERRAGRRRRRARATIAPAGTPASRSARTTISAAAGRLLGRLEDDGVARGQRRPRSSPWGSRSGSSTAR